ncbi:OTU-like cysteine protease-like [Zostera marina]|uniref:ubiquitinyl hydrolase 1 n=1 Tax=Zostera marina TaxID=29655 RepID=A0A0K9PK28_ZOSMR|nr:OTU-like cysteine protease-like [Zostera marina]
MAHSQKEVASSSNSIAPLSRMRDTEDDRMIALLLSEEYAKMDGAIGRRLTSLPSIPHVPRINNYFPSTPDVSMDHERLLQRLHAYGLLEKKVSGDGNCQFRAISDQLFKTPEHHKYIRKHAVKQLKEFQSLYEGYVPMKYKRYCKKMKKSGEWGDHLTLQAASDKFGAKICLLTSFRDTCFVEIVPQQQAPQREIWLSFWSEVHYNSVYDARVVPDPQKQKKKHWLF